jgi:alkylation response protein AidB-like acyl-CoA dehydrogenase
VHPSLSKEDRAFAEAMRDFFTSQIPAEIRDRLSHGGQLTKEDTVTSQRIMNAHGLAVPHWPTEWGGRDWTPIQRHLWSEEMRLAFVPPPLAFNTQMIGPVMAQFGDEEMRRRFLPATANLDIWWCQGFSEPDAGSDLASLRTTAVRDGDEYIVNGQKTWTSFAQHADWIFNLVRTDPEAKKQRGISMLLIDMRTPGISVRPIQLIDGSSEVNEVFFDNVRVPAENLVGAENRAWDYAKFLLGNERTGIAAIGATKARLLRIKRLAGASLDDQPLLRSRVTMLEVELTALETSVLRTLEKPQRSGKPDPMSSILKLKGSELQQKATQLLVDVLGPAALPYCSGTGPEGSDDAFPAYFNGRKISIYGGSSEVQRTIIAKQILGL